MKFRSYVFVTTALTVLAGTTSADAVQAQTATASSDEVIVTGIRKSLQSSVKVKKATDAVVDVISAEDVGKFPDTNVAESLSHLPGVSVDRNFGEGEKVSILGTDPALNRILVDGHTIASADWGGNPNDPTSRTFNYSLLAPEIIGQARVYKGPEAWIDEGSLGGTVIIDTRKPLDLKSGTLNASLGYSYNDRSEKGDVRGSVLYSWHNEAKNFGILVAATYDKEQLHRAGIEYFGYSGGDSFDGAFTKTRDSNNNVTAVTGPNINGAAPTVDSYNQLMAARVPCCFNWAYFDQDRERTGLSAAVQWKPADNAEINLTALHINGDYTNYNQSMYSVPVWNSSNASDLHVSNGIVTHGIIPAKAAGQGTLTQYDAILRNTIVKTDSVNLAAKWTGDRWKISANGGFTRATGGKEPERMISFNANSGFTFDFGPDHTTINFNEDPKLAGQFSRSPDTNMTLNGVSGTYVQLGGKEMSTTTDRELYGQVDVSRELNGDVFKKVLFGFKASAHTNELDAVGYDYFTNKTAYLSDFASELTPENLFADMGGSGNAMQYLGLTREGVLEAVNGSITRFNGPKYDMEFKVRETINAAYIQGNFSYGALHGNAGLRLVDTSDESTYWNSTDSGKTYQPVTVTHKSLDPLPAVNLVYDLSDDVLLKFGVAKVIARPRYSQLAGSFSLDNTALTGGGGNPDLKPYKSTNFEGSAEWYFGKTGMLTGEVFYRDIASYVVSVTNDETHFNTSTSTNATYFITRPVNAQNAKVKGMSVQFQKDIAFGFGIIANYTYADAETGGNYNMPYLSKNTFNVIPYYEAGPAQVRLSWSSRSKYFTGIGRRNSQDFADGYTQVDLSASYKLNDHLSFYANGQNLLDETYYSFSSVTVAPTAFYKNGRRFMIGVNYKM